MGKVIEGLTKGFYDAVARNQDPLQRNRVTMKDRAGGFINYLGASLLTKVEEAKNQR